MTREEKTIKEAIQRWIEDYNFNKAFDRECAAGVYVPSLRKLTSEELKFILVHEELRKVLNTGKYQLLWVILQGS